MGSNCTGKIVSKDFDPSNCDVVLSPRNETKVQRSFDPKFLSELEQQYPQQKIHDFDFYQDRQEFQPTSASTQQKETEIKLKIPNGILRAPKSLGTLASEKRSVKFQLDETLTVTRTKKKLASQPQFYSLGEKQNKIHFKYTNQFLSLSKQMSSQELE